MKSSIFGIAIACSVAAASLAAQEHPQLAPIQAQGAVLECTAPDDHPLCAQLYAAIEQEFRPFELNILFGSGLSGFATSRDAIELHFAEFLSSYNATLVAAGQPQVNLATTGR